MSWYLPALLSRSGGLAARARRPPEAPQCWEEEGDAEVKGGEGERQGRGDKWQKREKEGTEMMVKGWEREREKREEIQREKRSVPESTASYLVSSVRLEGEGAKGWPYLHLMALFPLYRHYCTTGSIKLTGDSPFTSEEQDPCTTGQRTHSLNKLNSVTR